MSLPSLELTNLIISFLSTNLKIALKTLQIENFKKHLIIKNIYFTARQPKKLRNLLVRAKFETKTVPKEPKLTGCDTKDVIYILICKACDNFYLGQTQDFKQRTAKHKSDVKKPA